MAITRTSQSTIKQRLEKNTSFFAGIPPILGRFESIATVTVGSGGASSITFSDIPGTYQHLQIRILAKSTVSPVSSIYSRFNGTGDASTAYALHYLYGDGGTAAAGGAASGNSFYVGTCTGNYANTFGASVVDILDYASTSKNKVIRSLSGADVNGSGGYLQIFSGLYASTSAVTSISIYNLGQTWQQHTTAALYGLRAP